MCSRMKYDFKQFKLNDLVPCLMPDGSTVMAPWLGHSRQESIPPKNATLVKLNISTYTERDVEFQVPSGHVIDAYLVKNDNFPLKEGVFIITRPASTTELKKCKHPRHPRIVKLVK